MLKLFLVTSLAFSAVSSLALAQTLSGSVILRVDARDGSTAVVSTNRPANQQQAQTVAQQNSTFRSLPQVQQRSELDRDGGTASFYFYNPYRAGRFLYPNYYNYAYAAAANAAAYNAAAYNSVYANAAAVASAYYTYNSYYYAPTVTPSAVYPSYAYYGSYYSPYYVYNSSPYTYYYYGLGW